MQFHVYIHETRSVGKADEIALGIVGDRALRYFFHRVGKLCGFPAMEKMRKEHSWFEGMGIDNIL